MTIADVLPPLSTPYKGKLGALAGMLALIGGLLIATTILSNVFQVTVTDPSPPSGDVQIAWDADSTTGQTPSGRTCTLVNAVIDTVEFNEGTGSMKFTSPTGDVQGDYGCKDFGQTTLDVNWHSGEWLCYNFDMKIDSGFNWNVNQNKIKASRIGESGDLVWTMYLNKGGVDISECPGCNGCVGGDRCSVMSYDMDPGGANPVTNWQNYTIGIKLETGSGNDDGLMKFWVDGTLEDSEIDQAYCTSCSGALIEHWGVFAMRVFPQSPDGIIWFDDYVMTVGTDECTPRS